MPERPADAEFFLSNKEVAQALADYLCKTGRVEGTKTVEATMVTVGLGGEPTKYQLWWRS